MGLSVRAAGADARRERPVTFTYPGFRRFRTQRLTPSADYGTRHDEATLHLPARAEEGLRAFIEEVDSRLSSDSVHVYSPDHDVVHQTEVTNVHTTIEDDVRPTYDVIVRGGSRVGENAVVGARGVVQSDVPAHHIAVGMPAKSIAVKPGWEDVAEPVPEEVPNERESRKLPYELPEDVEVFDEFGRDRCPPGGS